MDGYGPLKIQKLCSIGQAARPTKSSVGLFAHLSIMAKLGKKHPFARRLMKWPLAVALVASINTATQASSQPGELFEVRGTVRADSGQPLAGATVVSVNGGVTAQTGETGSFLMQLPAGRHLLQAGHPSTVASQMEVEIHAPKKDVDFVLMLRLRIRENVIVGSIRADETIPVTTTNLEASDIARSNYGQELPFLLKNTPSVLQYSDSGIGAGYSYFSLRGISQTRINMTLDGIPLNEPEDSAVYFSNFGDFSSAVESIQIQRGVGTSTVGTASFGGSINFASVSPREKAGVSAQIGGGSFGSRRGSLAFHSGGLGSGLSLYGRVSLSTTDGFREHSGADQRAVYYGAVQQLTDSFLKISGFSGRTRTGLAYLAAEEGIIKENLRFNPLSPEEKDDFGQDFFQLQYSRSLPSHLTLSWQAYYNGVQGWIRIRDTGRAALLQYGINGHLTGAVLSADYNRGPWNAAWVAHVSRFVREHSQDIVGGDRTYNNAGFKHEANTFFKLSRQAGPFHLYGDAQLRWARFRYRGDLNLGPVSWTFFNPKMGIRWKASSRLGLYASLGRAVREPTRNDLLAGEDHATVPYDLRSVKPEKLTDLEFGTDWQRRNLRLHINGYVMEFRNEIALTGEMSEIGLPLRRNVGQSYRRGIELEVQWKAHPQLQARTGANLSHNRIGQWLQYYDVYDAKGDWIAQENRTHRHVAPLLTPSWVLNQALDWSPRPWIFLSLAGRYVSHSQLDNTNLSAFRLPQYLDLEAGLVVELNRIVKAGQPRLQIQTTNLLNRREMASGYSYLFYVRDGYGRDTLSGTSYYYPLATRALYAGLEFSW